LEQKHGGHYKIFNLCAERTYAAYELFPDVPFEWIPFLDHCVPRLEQLAQFCRSAIAWLVSHPDNVVVVHCKAGKGRTGLMICALILHAYQQAGSKATELLGLTIQDLQHPREFYGNARTHDGNGLTIPSQLRYLELYFKLLRSPATYVPIGKHLKSVMVTKMPSLDMDKMSLQISEGIGKERRLIIVDSKPNTSGPEGVCFLFESLELRGDLRFCIKLGGHDLFWFWFNAGMVGSEQLCLLKSDLDKAHKSRSSIYPDNLQVLVCIEQSKADAEVSKTRPRAATHTFSNTTFQRAINTFNQMQIRQRSFTA